MTLSIRDRDTDQLARTLAVRHGKSITAVVKEALCDYAEKAPPISYQDRKQRIDALLAEFDRQPIYDHRSAKEIIDDLYDEDGLPK